MQQSKINKQTPSMRMRFSDLFEIHERKIRPKVEVELKGVRLKPGETYDDASERTGINLLTHRECCFDVEKKDGVYVIRTIYD